MARGGGDGVPPDRWSREKSLSQVVCNSARSASISASMSRSGGSPPGAVLSRAPRAISLYLGMNASKLGLSAKATLSLATCQSTSGEPCSCRGCRRTRPGRRFGPAGRRTAAGAPRNPRRGGRSRPRRPRPDVGVLEDAERVGVERRRRRALVGWDGREIPVVPGIGDAVGRPQEVVAHRDAAGEERVAAATEVSLGRAR